MTHWKVTIDPQDARRAHEARGANSVPLVAQSDRGDAVHADAFLGVRTERGALKGIGEDRIWGAIAYLGARELEKRVRDDTAAKSPAELFPSGPDIRKVAVGDDELPAVEPGAVVHEFDV
jgi:hypothetical protein